MQHTRITRMLRAAAGVGLFVCIPLMLGACGPSATPAPTSVGPYGASTTAPAATSAPAATYAAAAPGRTSAPAPTTAGAATQPAANGPSSAEPVDRKIIKNAQLSMTIRSVDEAMIRITGIASDVGGYLVGSRSYVEGGGNSGRRGAQAVIAVPVDRYEEALNRVRQVAYTVESDTSASTDVTEQFTDLQSRLRNLESTAVRIRDFLGKAQTVDEALRINAQLADVDGQIEVIKGKLNAMTARTTYSTITADMHELVPTATPTGTPTSTPTPTATPTMTPNAWHPDQTFTTAATVQSNLVSALVRTLGDFLIWFVVVIVPYVLILGIIAAVIRWILSWLFRTPRTPSA